MDDESDDDLGGEMAEGDAARLDKIRKEREDLLSSLAGADYSALKTQVAAVLNNFPHTRNNDTALTLKVWEVFQPEFFDPAAIPLKHLFKLVPQNLIVRTRAKIQNEYQLFQASDKVRHRRRALEEKTKEAIIEDAPPAPITFAYADETGKTQDFVIVAAVWVMTSNAVFTLTRAIKKWQEQSLFAKREIHFARMGKQDKEPLAEYLSVVLQNSEYLSFKVAAVERARTRRSIEDTIARLHEHLIIEGTRHEITSGRIGLPRALEFSLDREQSLDAFALLEMRGRASQVLTEQFGKELVLSDIRTSESRHSPLIQLADMVAGAINRRLNNREARNFKDDFADQIIGTLGLNLAAGRIDDLDSIVHFLI